MSFSRRYTFFLLALPLIAIAGCVQSSRTSPHSADAGGGNIGSIDADSPDAKTDANASPDEIVASVDIRLEPGYHSYVPGSKVEASATVFDAQGNKIDNPKSVSWSAEPSDAVKMLGGGTIKFQKQGVVTLGACATISGGQEICGQKEVAVDSDLPSIEITKPKPGAMLGGGNSQTITVEGSVTDTNGNVTAVLNGERLQLGENGQFSTDLDPEFGINTIRIVANDGINRADTRAARAVLWAPAYKQLGSDLSFSFDKGIAVDLGQNFFDDANPPARRNMGTELVTRDFTDILRVLANNIDLMSKIPNPLIDSGGTTLAVDNITLGQPDIAMDVTDSGLKAYLHINSLVLQTSGQAQIEGQTLDLTGTVSGRISAFTSIGVDKPSANDSFQATVETVDISLDSVTPNLASKQANALFKLAEGALRTKLEDELVGAVRQEIIATLPQMITETLNSLEQTLADQTFSFSSELTGTRKIHFKGDIDTFETTFRQSMRGVISNTIETPGTDVHTGARGIPLANPAATGIPFYDAGRIQLGFRLGLLNGILTGIWKTGYLDLDLSDSLPSQISGVVEKAIVESKLPAVIRPAKRSEPYDLILEAGQIEIETKALGQTDRYGVNVQAGVNVSLKDSKLSLELPDKPQLDSWVIATTGESVQIPPEDLNRLILTQIWPRIEKSLKGGMSIALPTPNISQLEQISPTLSNLSLAFVLQRPLTVRNGYVIFDSALEGTLPIGN